MIRIIIINVVIIPVVIICCICFGIKLLWTDGLVYDDLPFEISERFQMMEQYYYDITYEDPFDKL